MKKHTSKFLAVFLTLAMMLGLLTVMAVPASALVCSGCSGTGWELCFQCAGTGEYLTCPGEHAPPPKPCGCC